MILKFYDPLSDPKQNDENLVKAINHAIVLKVDVINISGGGTTPIAAERKAIKQALASGIKIVAAAGNESSNMKYKPYYPAMYFPEIIVVASVNSKGMLLDTSNYSKKWIDYKELGYQQVGSYGQPLTGTSQATAIRTGKEISKMYTENIIKANIRRRTADVQGR